VRERVEIERRQVGPAVARLIAEIADEVISLGGAGE
jgi:hypothetical protein